MVAMKLLSVQALWTHSHEQCTLGKGQREGDQGKLPRRRLSKRSPDISFPVIKVSRHQFPSYRKRKDVQGTSAKAQKPETSIAHSRNRQYFATVVT